MPILMNVLHVGLWIIIVLFAFFMQVMPFFLVLILINLSFGISSEIALVVMPAVLFTMLILACVYASIRSKRRVSNPISVYRNNGPDLLRGLATCMLPHSRRFRLD